MAKDKYLLKVAGLERELPIVAINEELSIASFVILGDTELVCAAADALCQRLPEVDCLITAEAKGIPLIFEMSRLLGMKRYYVARKSVKAYMEEPVITEVNSITTHGKQILCLDGKDAKAIKGKKVAIVDDVISTGQSLQAVEELVEKAGAEVVARVAILAEGDAVDRAEVVARVAILAEGDAVDRTDIIFLEPLPLFARERS